MTNSSEFMRGYNKGLKAKIEHTEPSPETRKLIEEIQKENKKQLDCINNMTTKINGMTIKINEMHAVFTSTKFTGKVIVGFFAVAGIISGGIFAIIKLFSSMGK